MDNLDRWWGGLSEEQQLYVLRYVVEHRFNPHQNLARQLGFENTGKAFDLNLLEGSIRDEHWRNILCESDSVLCEVKGQPDASLKDRVFIEHTCSGRPSGIRVTCSKWIILPLGGDQYQEEVAVVIDRDRLLHISRGCYSTSGGDDDRAEGWLVPIRKLVAPARTTDKPQQGTFL